MSKKLFVGSLSWNTTDASLQAAFAQFGEVIEAKVVLDRDTGRSRGFGFVVFAQNADGDRAVQELNGAELDGRAIRVDEARERERGPRPGGGPGGGFGASRGPGGGGPSGGGPGGGGPGGGFPPPDRGEKGAGDRGGRGARRDRGDRGKRGGWGGGGGGDDE